MILDRNKKTLCITFIRSGPKNLYVCNGFSFFRHFFSDIDDYFLDVSDPALFENQRIEIKKLEENYEQILCSIYFPYQFFIIESIINQKWVLGGPHIEKRSDILNTPGTLVNCAAELYMNEPVSMVYTPYFLPLIKKYSNIKKIYSGVSLGDGCYWNKCSFCNFSNDVKIRGDIADIFDQIPEIPGIEQYLYSSMSATPPKQLKEIINYSPNLIKKNITLRVYCRGDDNIVDILEQADDLRGLLVNIGPEVLSTRGMSILNKGYTMENVMRIVDCTKKGLQIQINIIHDFNFFDKDMFEEAKYFHHQIKNRDNGRSYYHQGDHCRWINLTTAVELVEKYGGILSDVIKTKERPHGHYKIFPGSEAKKYSCFFKALIGGTIDNKGGEL